MRSVVALGMALACGQIAGCSGKSEGNSQTATEGGGRSDASGGRGGSAVASGGTSAASGAANGGESARGGSTTSSGGKSASGGSGSRGGGTAEGGAAGGTGSAEGGDASSSGGVTEAGGSAGGSEAGSAGSGAPECEPGEVRCLTQRERCTDQGTWEKVDDYVCAIDLAGSAEALFFCAVKADGAIICWGDDFRIKDLLPAPAAVGTWRRIFLADDAGGAFTMCALDDLGVAKCWRTNEGASTFVGPMREMVVGQYGTFGITEDGSLRAFDTASVEDLLGSDAPGPFVHLVLNDERLLALAEDGTVRYRLAFPDGVFRDVATSNNGVCGVTEDDGRVLCNPPANAEFPFADERFVDMEMQEIGDVCGITEERAVKCWDGASNETREAPSGEFTRLAAGRGNCGLRTDGSVTCWGQGAVMPPESLQ